MNILFLLDAVLLVLNSHSSTYPLGFPIVKLVLASNIIRRLTQYLTSADRSLVLAALKLFGALSSFGTGRDKRTVLEAFPWGSKVKMQNVPNIS